MRIIKKGKWSMPVTCPHCKSDLEIEGSDVKYGDFGFMEAVYKYFIICGNCSLAVPLVESQLMDADKVRAKEAFEQRKKRGQSTSSS